MPFPTRRSLFFWTPTLLIAILIGAILWFCLPIEPRANLPGHYEIVWLSKNGEKLLTLDRLYRPGDDGTYDYGKLRLWNTLEGRELKEFSHREPFKQFWMSPGGRWIVVGPNAMGLSIIERATGEEWPALFPNEHERVELLFSPSGEHFAIGGFNEPRTLIQTSTGAVLMRTKTDCRNGQFTGDGKLFIFTFMEGDVCQVGLCSTQTGRVETVWKTGGDIYAISPDARTLVANESFSGGIVTMWDIDNSTKSFRARLATKSRALAMAAFSPDGKVLATWNCEKEKNDTIVEFWNVETGHRIAETPPGFVSVGGFSLDGRRFFVLGGNPALTRLTLHDVATGEPLWSRSWPMDPFTVKAKFCPHDKRLTIRLPSPGRALFLDPATGHTETTAHVGPEGTGSRAWNEDTATPDKRLGIYLELVIVDTEPSWFDAILHFVGIQKPNAQQKLFDRALILEMETGREVFRLENRNVLFPAALADDGRTLVTPHKEFIACWDVPGTPPFRWVFGVPVTLIVVAVIVRRLWEYPMSVASAGDCGPSPATEGQIDAPSNSNGP